MMFLLALILMVYLVTNRELVDSSGGELQLSKRQTHMNDNEYRLSFEKRLIDDLFRNYQVKFGRPVNNMSEKVVVYFGIYLIQIIDLVN